MADHKSALKRIRQSAKRVARNTAERTRIRKIERKFRESLNVAEIDSEAKLKEAVKLWSRAASKGIIPAGRAARKISRLTKCLNAHQSV